MSRVRAGGRSQNPRLLTRGNAISGAPIIRGRSQFPNPPMKIGVIKKNSINSP